MWRLLQHAVVVLLFATCVPSDSRAQTAGTMQFDPVDKQYAFFDGAQWYNLGLGVLLGLCSTPGKMEYDPVIILSYKYCNGTNWIRILGVPTLMPCSKAGKMDFFGSTYMVCNGLVWTNIKGAQKAS